MNQSTEFKQQTWLSFDKTKQLWRWIKTTSLFQISMTFIILHFMYYMTLVLYYHFRIDLSFYGFIRSLIVSHNPVCHALMTITYQSQANINQLFQNLAISTGITWLYNRIKNE